MANEDALTSLPNRHWLNNMLPDTLERARLAGNQLAVFFIDLDDFKNVNDTLGHAAGDSLLREVAGRLRSVLRPSDYVVRLGGDEFTVILDPVDTVEDVAYVASRIIEVLRAPFDLLRGRNTIGTSIGITMFPRDGEDAETLLKNSDIAMYHAKAQGKGNFRFFQPELYENLKVRLDTERALIHALGHNQFVLYYEPRICSFTGELRGLEALVRWQHPEQGLVLPGQFIPLAEDNGLILKLGEVVLEKACAQLSEWKRAGLKLVPLSINVSARQFNNGNIKTLFENALARHDIPSEMLEIELTESSMMGEHSDVLEQLSAIKKMGIKLLVDDFGTGYSSLSQLQRLDMDVLKVDRSFTSDLGSSAEGEIFFNAIVSMAHALGMLVVAEGVENEQQLRILQSLSCDEIQGYFIARPVPAEDVPALLRKRFIIEHLVEGENSAEAFSLK
jgi:diguanylate cyclase (GGDEF)-like protein